jgi:hypothetical protein
LRKRIIAGGILRRLHETGSRAARRSAGDVPSQPPGVPFIDALKHRYDPLESVQNLIA